jgi:hypothetical protein
MSRNVRPVLFIEPPPKRQRDYERALWWSLSAIVVFAPVTALGLYVIAQTLPAKLQQLSQVWP